MANTSAIWEQATHTTHTKSAPSCSSRAIQKREKKKEEHNSYIQSLKFNEKCLRVSAQIFFLKKS